MRRALQTTTPRRYSPPVRRLLLVLFTVLFALVVIDFARRSLASDEARIRWLVEAMAEGFEDRSAGRAVGGLAKDWRDLTSGIEREELRQGLVAWSFERRDSAGEAPYRVELPEERFEVALDPEDEDAARLACVARFLERDGEDAERVVWEVAIEAELERREEGWRIVRTTHETLLGRRIGFGR